MTALTARRIVVTSRFSRSEIGWPVLLAAYTQVDVWPPSRLVLGHVVGPRPVLSLLYVVTSLALVWRRRAPLTVLAFIVTADTVYYLGFGAPEGLGCVLPMLFAFYAVGRYAAARELTFALPLVLLGGAVHEMRDPILTFTGLEAILWAVVAAAWVVGWAFRRRAPEADALAAEARRLTSERDSLAREVATEERARIARELHDVVGHALSVLVLQLVATAALIDEGQPGAARGRLGGAERTARQALEEMRRLLGLLDRGDAVTSSTQPGLAGAERLIAESRAAGAAIDLHVRGVPVELPPGLDLAAYRILQESLTNVLRHADPPHAEVCIDYAGDRILIRVDDHGLAASEPSPGGRGISGMRERARLYGGRLEVGPRPGGGYSVQALLPIGG